MITYALVRYDRDEGGLKIAGAYFSAEAAMDACREFRLGSGCHWLPSDGHALMAAQWTLYGSDATWYITWTEFVPSRSWYAAAEALRMLRRVLWGIVRHGVSW